MDISGKIWGSTSKIFDKNNVEIHRIEGKKNHHCSKHKHDHKFNMFFLEKGEIRISIWKNDYNLVDKTILKAGQSCIVSPGEYHKFTVLKDSVAYEVYWVELDSKDIVRDSVGGFGIHE
ncbi:MAG: hypothetical protein ACTSSP_01435 [Candidatus Asgardarchaeia archaeon]